MKQQDISKAKQKVKVGDKIALVNNSHFQASETEAKSAVQKVYPDGRILTDDNGHGVIAAYGLEGYDAWVIEEDAEEGDIK